MQRTAILPIALSVFFVVGLQESQAQFNVMQSSPAPSSALEQLNEAGGDAFQQGRFSGSALAE
jgi:hypothetical protein